MSLITDQLIKLVIDNYWLGNEISAFRKIKKDCSQSCGGHVRKKAILNFRRAFFGSEDRLLKW